MPADVKTWSIREIVVQSRNADVWIWKDLGVHPASGKQISPQVALTCSSILSCVRVISETVASFNIEVYRKKDRSKVIAPGHPLYRLLSVSPAPYVTAFSWIETIVAWVCVWGNAYCEIVRSRGVVIRLVPLHPSRMHVEETAEGVIRYSYDNPVTGESDYYTPDQLLHFKWLSNDGGLTGMVPVELAADAIELARACDLRALATAKNGASPSIVLETEHSVPENAQEKIRDQWRQIYGGVMNAGKTAILPNGLKAHELGRSNRDNELASQQERSLRDIARVYRVPPNMLGLSGGSPQRNPEIAGIELLRSCGGPWILRLEKEMELKLFEDDPDHTPEFDVKAILRTDSASRSRMLTTEIQLGLSTINEGRRSEGREPVEGGDTVLLSHNFNTLEALLAAAQAAAKQAENPTPGLPAPGRQPPGRRKPGKNSPNNPDPAGQQIINGGVESVAKKLKRGGFEGVAKKLRRPLSKRSLNPCGQDGDGTFDKNNTCAAGDGRSSAGDNAAKVAAGKKARLAKEAAKDAAAGREKGHTGDRLADAAHEFLFEKNGSPSGLLQSSGWNVASETRTSFDADVERVSKSLTEGQKRSFSGAVAGVALAMKQFKTAADVAIRVSTVDEERDLAAKEFSALNGMKVDAGFMSQAKYDKELAAAIEAAGAVAGYYSPMEDTLTLVADRIPSAAEAKSHYAARSLSSPSRLHVGFHEAVHVAHWREMRFASGVEPFGGLEKGSFTKLVAKMHDYAFDAAIAGPLAAADGGQSISKKVSRYAAANPREFVAEYVTGVALGGIDRDREIDAAMDLLHAPAVKTPKVVGDRTRILRETLRA